MAWAAYIATNILFSLQSAHIPEKTERGPHDGRCQGTVGIQSAQGSLAGSQPTINVWV